MRRGQKYMESMQTCSIYEPCFDIVLILLNISIISPDHCNFVFSIIQLILSLRNFIFRILRIKVNKTIISLFTW